jgi:hypothetical protein
MGRDQPLTFLYCACSSMRMLDALQWLMPAIVVLAVVVLAVIVHPFNMPSSLCHLHCAIFIVPSSLCHLHCAIVIYRGYIAFCCRRRGHSCAHRRCHSATMPPPELLLIS